MKKMTPSQKKYVGKILSDKFRVKFVKRRVPLRGTDKPYKFDLVSPDNSIVAEVKGAKYKG